MIKLRTAALAYARQPGFNALIFSDVKPPTGQAAAYKQAAADDMHGMGLTVLTENIFYGKPTGRRSERTTMAVIAQHNGGADRWLRSVLSGRPLDGSVMQTAASFGAITLRDGSIKAKVQLLPFDGNEYGVFAFVDAALLLNEVHGSERLSLIQRLMVTPMVRAAAGQLVAATEATLALYEAESANESLEAAQRRAATQKAVHQSGMRDALNRIMQSPDDYILVAPQPLQSFPCLDALDAAVPLIARNDSDTDALRRRSALGWAFARDSSIATVIVRKACHVPLDARAAMMVAQRLLRTPTPAAASVLRPTGSVPDVKLVKPSKVAESRITAAAVKAKLHILACDQPWGYAAVADANSGNTDQATYIIPHYFALTADAETWAEAFRVASRTAGTPVDLVIESAHFSVTTLPTYTGPVVHVYSIEDVVVDVNAECNTAVGTDGINMEFSRAEVADATPTNLRRAVESGGHLAAIVRWSRLQPPGTDPLPWHAETIPAATLAPGWPGPAGGTHAIAFATTSPPARFEGLTQTIARVNNIESVLAAVAQSQAQTSSAIVQLTASVAALVQHAGIAITLPPAPPPTPPPQSFAAITAATPPAAAPVALETNADMEEPAAGASAANTGFQPSSTTASAVANASAQGHTGASPSAEMDLNDGSMPVPDVAPVSRRTQLSLTLASMLPPAAGTAQGTAEGPSTWAAMTRRVRFADEHEWDDEYDASTADEYDDSNYILFDEDDGDAFGADGTGDGDDTQQHEGESHEAYEDRLNGMIPPPEYFCCWPVFF